MYECKRRFQLDSHKREGLHYGAETPEVWAELPHSIGGGKGQQHTDIAVLSSVWQAAVPEVQSLDLHGNEEVAAAPFILEETCEHDSRVARIEVHGGARQAQGISAYLAMEGSFAYHRPSPRRHGNVDRALRVADRRQASTMNMIR